MLAFVSRSREQRSVPSLVRALRLGALGLHIALTSLGCRLLSQRFDERTRERRARRWSAILLRILGVRVVLRGRPPLPGRAVLFVANHITWLDVQALSTVHGARFVAKHEVADWPLIGRVARHIGTVFFRRRSYRETYRAVNAVTSTLRAQQCVAVFPEGTTTQGESVETFRPAFLQAAINSGVPVQPLAISYSSINGVANAAIAYAGERTFLSSLWAVLREPRLTVELHFGPELSARNTTRRELAALAHHIVRARLEQCSLAPLAGAAGNRRRRSIFVAPVAATG